MKDDCTTISHYLTYTFHFRKIRRMYFLNLGVKGLISCSIRFILSMYFEIPPTQHFIGSRGPL